MLRVLYWNVYIGHNPNHVRKELRKMIRKHKPDVIGLGEASRCYGMAHKVRGYEPYAIKESYRGEGDTIALVRNGTKLRKWYWMRMTKWWTGPKNGFRQGPKRYWAGRIRDDKDNLYRLSIGHWPFNTAREETENRVVAWFHAADKGDASIHLGDLNTRADDMDRYVKRFGGDHKGVGIDRAMFKNCKARVLDLGKHGSDHPAVLFTFYR